MEIVGSLNINQRPLRTLECSMDPRAGNVLFLTMLVTHNLRIKLETSSSTAQEQSHQLLK